MPEDTLAGNRPESSIQVWGNLLEGLERGGFSRAAPEYLKLAHLVSDVRRTQIATGRQADPDGSWARLSAIGSEVLSHLLPLVEGARLLAELPRARDSAAPPPPVPAPDQPVRRPKFPAASPGAPAKTAERKRPRAAAKRSTPETRTKER